MEEDLDFQHAPNPTFPFFIYHVRRALESPYEKASLVLKAPSIVAYQIPSPAEVHYP